MIAHKVTFYGNGQRPALGQSAVASMPMEPKKEEMVPNGSLLNTVLLLGTLAAVAVLAITVINNAASKD